MRFAGKIDVWQQKWFEAIKMRLREILFSNLLTKMRFDGKIDVWQQKWSKAIKMRR